MRSDSQVWLEMALISLSRCGAEFPPKRRSVVYVSEVAPRTGVAMCDRRDFVRRQQSDCTVEPA